MGRQKLTEEEKEANFNNWMASDEFQAIAKFELERSKLTSKTLELAAVDLCEDIQPFLDSLWAMVGAVKAPKKTKARKLIITVIIFFSL